MNILITGGAGYIGAVLCPFLLDRGHCVRVIDTCYFGSDFLPKNNKNFELVVGDIRNQDLLEKVLNNIEVVIHLACISNDASFVLDEELSTSINLHAFEPLVLKSKKHKVRRFIYASSSSVYGVSEKKNVTEDHPLVPLTLYNKYKGLCEPILIKHIDDNFEGVIFRPATVCGYSPRLRLDLSVNILTNHAISNNIIKVFGGEQLRPNLHIMDYVDAVDLFLNAPKEKINGEIFNVGYQNIKIIELAKLVKETVEVEFNLTGKINLEITHSDDNRSYHINSDKIYKSLNFKPKREIKKAIVDLSEMFKKNKIKNSMDDSKYFNVKRLQEIKAK